MTFSDIFTSSFLDNISSVTLLDMGMALLLAFGLGLFIFLVYQKTFSGVMYSSSFGVALIAIAMITTVVILAVTSNVVLSLGMVGALSIVRFRTAIKDSRDTVYIFWTIVTGICCGSGDFLIAGIGGAFTFLILLIFGRIKNDNRVLFIIRTARVNEARIEALMFQYFARKANLRVKNTTENSVEFIYEISKRILDKAGNAAKGNMKGKSITDAIYEIGNIEYCNMVMQNDEISS